MTPEVLRQLAEEWIPFNKVLGVRAVHIEPSDVLLEVGYRDELIGDPVKRALHGGVISALADTAGGLAVWSALDDGRARVSTIDLRVDYLRPGKQEDLRAHATLVRVGKTVGVSDVRLFHPSDEKATIATGKGVYAIRIVKDQLGGE
ncbi:MAG: hotdog fold thioesterase [Polyangiaceae bacterium]|nr:hotdog fold thioesterase [Polyangiaceae bacterium]